MRLAYPLAFALLLAPALAFGRAGGDARGGEGPGAPVATADLAPIPTVEAALADAVPDGPRRFRLGPASPNPFRGSTRLQLSVDAPARLTVAVFDALGRRVALLHDGPLGPGTYPLSFDARDLPAGLYVVRVTDGQGETATRSVALAR